MRRTLAKIGIMASDYDSMDADKVEGFLIVADELAKIEREKTSKGRRR